MTSEGAASTSETALAGLLHGPVKSRHYLPNVLRLTRDEIGADVASVDDIDANGHNDDEDRRTAIWCSCMSTAPRSSAFRSAINTVELTVIVELIFVGSFQLILLPR